MRPTSLRVAVPFVRGTATAVSLRRTPSLYTCIRPADRLYRATKVAHCPFTIIPPVLARRLPPASLISKSKSFPLPRRFRFAPTPPTKVQMDSYHVVVPNRTWATIVKPPLVAMFRGVAGPA